jgi:type II secretory pathway pseudopilin PulG
MRRFGRVPARGFTLVELLVAIIGVIVALLLPAVSVVFRSAKD